MEPKKIQGELVGEIGTVPMDYLNLADPFKWGEDPYSCHPWNPAPVGKEFKGESYKAQTSGGATADPFVGKGSM